MAMDVGGSKKGPRSDINVTPLVDVVLVLLIIFMVVTPLLEKDIEVRIPETEDVPVEQMPQDNSQLIVKLDADGTYSINTEQVQKDEYVNKLRRMLTAKKKEDRIVFFVADDKGGTNDPDPIILSVTNDKKMFVEQDEYDAAALEAKLKDTLSYLPNKKILLKGDSALTVGDVRQVMEVTRKAKAKKIFLGVEEQKN